MARDSRPSGTFSQNPAGDPQARSRTHPPEPDRGGEYGGEQYAGRGGRANEQTGWTGVGQHTDQMPEHAEPGHATTIVAICTC